jgi:hypothetical protein
MKKIIFLIITIYISISGISASWVDADGSGQESSRISNTSGSSMQAEVVTDASNNPHISWFDNTAGKEVYYQYWTGSAWVDVTGSGLANINASNTADVGTGPSLRLTSAGIPVISWGQSGGNTGLYVQTWNGSGWVGMDGTVAGRRATTVSVIGAGLMALNPLTNYPDASWDGINYIQWNGTVWTTSSLAGITAGSGNIDINGKKHFVYMSGSNLYYIWYNGTSWVGANGGTTSADELVATGVTNWTDKVETDQSGTPYVTYTAGNNIYCVKWNGSAWTDPSGTGNAFSNISNSGAANSSKLEIDSSGNPCVTWDDSATGNSEIYFLRWNGSAWVDVTGTGQAAKMVTATAGASTNPWLSISSDGTYHIVWCENLAGNDEIFYLKYASNAATPTYTPTVTPTFTPTGTPAFTPSQPEGDVRVYPNPFCRKTAVGNVLKFENLAVGSTISIMTMSGEIVNFFMADSGIVYWDGRNVYRKFVSPGIYYYLISWNNGAKMAKGKIYITNE